PRTVYRRKYRHRPRNSTPVHVDELVDFVHEPDDVDGIVRALLPLADAHDVHRVHAHPGAPLLDGIRGYEIEAAVQMGGSREPFLVVTLRPTAGSPQAPRGRDARDGELAGAGLERAGREEERDRRAGALAARVGDGAREAHGDGREARGLAAAPRRDEE